MRRALACVLLTAALATGSAMASEDKASPHGLGLLAGRVTDDAARERLKAGLADGRPAVRAAAVRVVNVSGVGALVPAVRDALAKETDHAAASEMMRFLGSINRPELDAAVIDAGRRLGAPTHRVLADALARRGAAAASLVPTLRELGFDDDAWRIFDRLAPDARAGQTPAPAAAAPVLAGVQTASGFPPGYVMDAMRAIGCDFDGFGRILGGEVTYAADGRPRHVALIRRDGSKECFETVRALLVSALAPLGVATRAEQKALLLVPDRPEFMSCLDEAAQLSPYESRRVGGEGKVGDQARLDEPRKVRDLRPHYPEAAKTMGTQGVVILEALVARSGCVHHLALLRGVDTRLDLEAMRAVSGWTYSPTLLNGEPVPITMTVAVHFKLAR
jgi:TonB family protein